AILGSFVEPLVAQKFFDCSETGKVTVRIHMAHASDQQASRSLSWRAWRLDLLNSGRLTRPKQLYWALHCAPARPRRRDYFDSLVDSRHSHSTNRYRALQTA